MYVLMFAMGMATMYLIPRFSQMIQCILFNKKKGRRELELSDAIHQIYMEAKEDRIIHHEVMQ